MSSKILPNVKYISVALRFLATLIDTLIWGLIYYLVFVVILSFNYLTSLTELRGLINNLIISISLTLAGMLIYYIVFEALFGATIGKAILGFKVIMVDGSKCTLKATIIRNILRVVDIFPGFYLIGALFIWASIDLRQRFGDLMAKTVVISRRSWKEQEAKPKEDIYTEILGPEE